MTTELLIIINCVAIAVLAAAIYFTRAPAKRAIAALVGGIAGALVGIGLDAVGTYVGWWYYIGPFNSHAPLLVYSAVAFAWGGLSLVSWRLAQRFGGKALAILIVAIAMGATVQDYVVAASKYRTQIISPGITPALGDVMVWLAVTLVAQGIMRGLAGNDQVRE